MMQTLVQPIDQTGAEDSFGPRQGDMEFGGKNRRRHRTASKNENAMRRRSASQGVNTEQLLSGQYSETS